MLSLSYFSSSVHLSLLGTEFQYFILNLYKIHFFFFEYLSLLFSSYNANITVQLVQEYVSEPRFLQSL